VGNRIKKRKRKKAHHEMHHSNRQYSGEKESGTGDSRKGATAKEGGKPLKYEHPVARKKNRKPGGTRQTWQGLLKESNNLYKLQL